MVRFYDVSNCGKIMYKPKIIIYYNKAKGAVDLSDQMPAYSTLLRKTIKWYKKLAINLLLNTTIVNAIVLYQQVTNKKIHFTDFRKEILKWLCGVADNATTTVITWRPRRFKHKLTKSFGQARKSRWTCQKCYKDNVVVLSRISTKNKTRKVNTYCNDCPTNHSHVLNVLTLGIFDLSLVFIFFIIMLSIL